MDDRFSQDEAHEQFPACLGSRDGWSDLFAARAPLEPHLHQIEPTNVCPYSCIMCPRSERMTRALGFMEMDLYRKVIDEVATFSEPVRSREIELFHFGESLLHPEVDLMVGHAADRGLNITLSVNAPQLTPELAERLLARRPAKIIISLDGFDDESYKAIRGPAADFALAKENIEQLVRLHRRSSARTQIVIRMIRLHANRDRVLPFKWEWERRGIPVDIRTFFPWDEPEMTELGEFGAYPPGMPCPFPWQYLVVQWNGDVVPCCRDLNARNRMGNVRSQSLTEIWRGERYLRLRQQMRTGDYEDNEVCRRCMSIYYTAPDRAASAPAPVLRPPDVSEALGDTGPAEDLPGVWREATLSYSGRPFVIDDDGGAVLTYDDADRVIARIAARLEQDGIGQGDRVALCCAPHSEALLLLWAAFLVGAEVMPLDPTAAPAYLRDLVVRTSPSLTLVDTRQFIELAGQGARFLVSDTSESPPDGALLFTDWLDQGESDCPSVTASSLALRPACVLYTSGTTGRPKGVVLSHKALAHSGRLIAENFSWRHDDILLSIGDLHTMSGLRNPAVAAVRAGCAIVTASEEARRNAIALVECADRNGATLLSGVPAVLEQISLVADRCGPRPLARLRCALVTGDVLAPGVREAFERRFDVPVFPYYGLTETAGFCAGELPGSPRTEPPSIGFPVDALFELFDSDGKTVHQGEVGELWIQSPNLMLGYDGDPEATERAFSGPRFRTGDLVRERPDGSFELVARLGDVVKGTHGELVSAREVEGVLLTHPEVCDAAVSVVAGGDGIDRLHAFVVPVADPAGRGSGWKSSVLELLLDLLGRKKLPASLRACAEIPRDTSGRVDQRQLRRVVLHER